MFDNSALSLKQNIVSNLRKSDLILTWENLLDAILKQQLFDAEFAPDLERRDLYFDPVLAFFDREIIKVDSQNAILVSFKWLHQIIVWTLSILSRSTFPFSKIDSEL